MLSKNMKKDFLKGFEEFFSSNILCEQKQARRHNYHTCNQAVSR
jgi:hypothetical protein